jgi:hypothetical protein
MASRHRRALLALLLSGIAVAAAIIVPMISGQSVQTFGTFKLRGKEDNPDAFYLCATGGVVSYGFIYDPHAADDWMFRTAGGSLGRLNRSK